MEHINKLTDIIIKQEELIKELTGKSNNYELKCFDLIEQNNHLKKLLGEIQKISKIKNIVKL
tara:strand:+ start:1774 stop:1959 length:186 start_codon:yes stop_codon:yes gene_type:complete